MRIRKAFGARLGAALVAAGLVAAIASTPANAASTDTAARSAVGEQSLPMHKKPPKPPKNAFNGCIDSSQQNNEKFVAYVPEPGQLWIWKENRGAGSVDPWVQFTDTPADVDVVCATITAHGNNVAVTIVTQNEEQQVWQADCTVNPDNANDPFDPNERCGDFEELTPLPDAAAAGDNNGSGPIMRPGGPRAGDGAVASSGPGAATAAGGALLGLALTAGTVALLRRRGHGAAAA
ncbi:hypothetical protein [Actinopolymorpha pittospori]|uniref:MYXO-CTERM domain-containing protein n=1 Tax=Actinopolymorpha pittospori TaxID=648752 RepID=A0A927R5F7_9ACTN|nr:hypothetical protein [Actinopolymorpha pittospori]MBE1603242.1 hypothetical protein [Actinopolymorpha pittospori]